MKKCIIAILSILAAVTISSVSYADCNWSDVVCTDGTNPITGTLKLKGSVITNTGTGGLVIDDGGYGWTIKSNGTTKLSVDSAGTLSTGSKVCTTFFGNQIQTGQTSGQTLSPSGAAGFTVTSFPYKGSIVALNITATNAVTAGEITATVVSAYGLAAGVSVTLSATNNGGTYNNTTQSVNTSSFNAGGAFGIQYTSSDSPAITGILGKSILVTLCVTQ